MDVWTYMHITHIKEVSVIYKYNVQVKSGKFYSSFVIGYSHNVVCIHYLGGGR